MPTVTYERFCFLKQIKKHNYKRLLSHNESQTYHYLKTGHTIPWSNAIETAKREQSSQHVLAYHSWNTPNELRRNKPAPITVNDTQTW